MAEQAKWYVIHTYAGYENKVADNLEKIVENRQLQDLIQEVQIPTHTVVDGVGDKAQEKEYKVFPSYVLVKMIMTDETWYIVKNIRGCSGFLGIENKPIALTEEEVKRIGVNTVKSEVSYTVGDDVNIISGSLNGFSGVVKSIDIDNNSVKVVISMFGRDALVELELGQVEKK